MRSRQSQRVVDRYFAVGGVVDEERRDPQSFQLVDAVDLVEAHAEPVLDAPAHRVANRRRDSQEPCEIARVLG
jgi:hypothetical protein